MQFVKHHFRKVPVTDLKFSSSTAIKDGVLLINRERIKTLVKTDKNVRDVKVELARPGESLRIVPIKDIVEPRLSRIPEYQLFPGVLYQWDFVRKFPPSGEIVSLDGAVVTTVGSIVGFQEGVIDMSGPGARYSLFSRKHHLVLEITAAEGIRRHDHEKTVRMAGLKVAEHIGRQVLAGALPETRDEIFVNPPVGPLFGGGNGGGRTGLPRIAYLYMLQSQGLLHDTYYCGQDAKAMAPRRIVPSEVLFGAIVSGNCVSACDKNTTWHHQNNPLILELLRRHGTDWEFVGCVLTNENVTLADKQRYSTQAADLIATLNPDGVIISKEGFGNPDADLMMNCSKIEAHGIRTVLLTDEFAGQAGVSQSLVDTHPKADAIVSTGNANEVIVLPRPDRVIGDDSVIRDLAGGTRMSGLPEGSVAIELQALLGSTNQLGFESLSARFR